MVVSVPYLVQLGFLSADEKPNSCFLDIRCIILITSNQWYLAAFVISFDNCRSKLKLSPINSVSENEPN